MSSRSSSVPHILVLPPSLCHSRPFHRKWLCWHPFVVTCQLFGFTGAKAKDRDPQPAARKCFGSAGIAGTFSTFQIQSCPGCNVVRCSAKELRWTGRTVALTKMWFIPSVVDKFLYCPVLKLSVEKRITASPFNTHSIVDSPRSASHFRRASDYNDDIAFKAKLPARETLPIKITSTTTTLLVKTVGIDLNCPENGTPVNDISENVLCTCTPASGVPATSPSIDTAATDFCRFGLRLV